MAARKRTNPKRIPVSPASIDQDAILAEVSRDNLYYAWLLVLPSLLDLDGMTRAKIVEIWDSVNQYASDPKFTGDRVNTEISRAEKLMGYIEPHQNLSFERVRSQGDLDALKRKLKENAIHSALCIIYLGLEAIKALDENAMRRLFLNASITLAEVQQGLYTYSDLEGALRENGISLHESKDDMLISDEDASLASEDSSAITS